MSELLHDWNSPATGRSFTLLDETLRDGIQSPSVRNPEIEQKLELLHCMEACGIQHVDVGLPGAGEQAVADVTRLVEEIRHQRLQICPNCAARTHPHDIRAVLEIAQKTGQPIEVCTFLGSSPMRRLVEGWSLEQLERFVAESVEMVVAHGLPASFVTEDTIRTDPTTLRRLFRVAVDTGASRLVLTDTAGHATGSGLANLVRFTRDLLRDWQSEHVELDWHGHNDRGLSLPLCLSALELGVDRLHGTCLGVGERVGNAPIDLLILNLRLLGLWRSDLRALRDYVEKASRYYAIPIGCNYPAFGSDAFRTSTGVHAAAILKAMKSGRPELADHIYSSVPASELGRSQRIEVGYYSGRANAQIWLTEHGLECDEQRLQAILELAKSSRHTLPEQEIVEHLRRLGLGAPA